MMKLRQRAVKESCFFNAELKINQQFLILLSFTHFILYHNPMISWTFFKNKVNNHYVCIGRGVNCDRFIKKCHSKYFLSLTCYFWDTFCLMTRKSNLFVYIFIANCHFFQINLSECLIRLKSDMLYDMNNTFQNTSFLIFVDVSLKTVQVQ